MTCPQKIPRTRGLTTAGVGLSLFPEVLEAHPSSLAAEAHTRPNKRESFDSRLCAGAAPHVRRRGKSIAALNHAIDLGITYLDTAYAYGDGKSESRVGKAWPTRRKDVWLATKIPDRTRDASFGASKAASLACKPITWTSCTSQPRPSRRSRKNRSPGWRAQGLAGSSRAETHAVSSA